MCQNKKALANLHLCTFPTIEELFNKIELAPLVGDFSTHIKQNKHKLRYLSFGS